MASGLCLLIFRFRDGVWRTHRRGCAGKTEDGYLHMIGFFMGFREHLPGGSAGLNGGDAGAGTLALFTGRLVLVFDRSAMASTYLTENTKLAVGTPDTSAESMGSDAPASATGMAGLGQR